MFQWPFFDLLSPCPLCAVLSKGQASTSHYRFLANCGGFVWAETQATVLYNSKTSQPESVVCLNFVLRYLTEKWQKLKSLYWRSRLEADSAPSSYIMIFAPRVQLGGDARRGFLRGAAPLWSDRSSLTHSGAGGLFDGRHGRLRSPW